MLPEEVKKQIQSAYTQLIEARSLNPRPGQRQMIAEIANCMASSTHTTDLNAPVCVIEAGTGTGKTLAYVLGVIPLAKKLGLKVVISTATVALQEQVILKDLPEILAACDLDFSFSLAKGRGRYLCLAKLDLLLQGNDSQQAIMDLYGEELDEPDNLDQGLYEAMLIKLSTGQWQGDRDEWAEPIANASWAPVTVDNTQCMGPKCSHFRNCCFYQARESMEKADCIVANHDLVLSDLALGGGAILSEPAKTLYVFDEAHHLAAKTNNHFSAYARLHSTISWLEKSDNLLSQLDKARLLESPRFHSVFKSLSQAITQTVGELGRSCLLLEQFSESLEVSSRYDNQCQYIFALGQPPAPLMQQAEQLSKLFKQLLRGFEDIAETLKAILEEGNSVKAQQQAQQWFPLIAGHCNRLEANLKLWLSYMSLDKTTDAPTARWFTITENAEGVEIALSSSPVLAAQTLQSKLWGQCAGAILTSATLAALGQFDMLKMRAGLPENTRYLKILSPFDYAHAARFIVPKMQCEPSDYDKHTDLIIKALPKALKDDQAALMLFSSRRQMLDVLQGLPQKWADLILCQDDYQKSQLIKYHKKRIDEGEVSIIFGLASFAEGVDLPGKYCTHVLIAKIPFAVPNDPIESTLAQWIEDQGKNAFMTLAVPDAAFRLVQASGRLLRNEKDSGKVTLFDERIVNKRYGRAILDSLPPFAREIFQQDYSL